MNTSKSANSNAEGSASRKSPERSRATLFRVIPPKELTFKIAETQDDLEKAYTILHDCYVAYGFMKPHPSGMRITPYHALPGTNTMVALWNGEIVGSLTAIKDSSFGLPMDEIFDLSKLRQANRTIAEISGLSILQRFASHRTEIMFPMIKHMMKFVREYLLVDTTVIAINPRITAFFDKVLLYEKLDSRTVEHYNFVNGAPAEGRVVDLHQWSTRLRRAFGINPPERNVYDYLMTRKLKNVTFPQTGCGEGLYPVMTAPMRRYFFEDRTKVLQELPHEKMRLIQSHIAQHDKGKNVSQNLFESYESAIKTCRGELTVLESEIQAEKDPAVLSLFLINFCSLGVPMTQPVCDWIRRAGENSITKGYIKLGQALIAHAIHEAGHDQLMRNDTSSLVKFWNERMSAELTAKEFIEQELSDGVKRYRNVHEHWINSDTPYAQIAIEYEIERVSIIHGPKLIGYCVNVLGTEILSCLSFIRDHVQFDVGHTQYNRRILTDFLNENPKSLPTLVEAGTDALRSYSAFLQDCLTLARDRVDYLRKHGQISFPETEPPQLIVPQA